MIDLAELEAQSAVLARNGCGGSCVTTSDDVLEIITRLRQAEKDAARYRWLRNSSSFDTAQHQLYCLYYRDGLDVAIDEAMQCK